MPKGIFYLNVSIKVNLALDITQHLMAGLKGNDEVCQVFKLFCPHRNRTNCENNISLTPTGTQFGAVTMCTV